MSLKSRLLGAFCVFSLVAFACATSQQGGGTQPGGSSTVEELPAENQAAGTSGGTTGAPASGTAAAAPAGPQLNAVGGPEEGFTAKVPGTPTVARQKVPLGTAGEVSTASWTSNVEGVVYSLSVADYPAKVVAARPPEAFLNEGRDGLLNQLKGTLKSEENITINDMYPGKAFTITSDNGEVKARNYLVGPRLYTLLTLYNPSVGAPAADGFLRSLALINPPPPIEVKARRPRPTDGGTPPPGDAGTP
jgi:hypothetical protein